MGFIFFAVGDRKASLLSLNEDEFWCPQLLPSEAQRHQDEVQLLGTFMHEGDTMLYMALLTASSAQHLWQDAAGMQNGSQG